MGIFKISGAGFFTIFIVLKMSICLCFQLSFVPMIPIIVLKDTGTQGVALVPWAGSYLPFCFLALITPLFSLFYGITGWTMTEKERTKKSKFSVKPVEA